MKKRFCKINFLLFFDKILKNADPLKSMINPNFKQRFGWKPGILCETVKDFEKYMIDNNIHKLNVINDDGSCKESKKILEFPFE